MDKLNILLIDDEEDVCYLTKLNLESTGRYEVDTARNGEEGLAKALTTTYDLIITDYKMPGVDGKEVLKTLKQHARIPVVLFSIYYDDPLFRNDDVLKSADGVISKPISKDDLITIIERTLAKGTQ